jgi:hypothetical protein
LIAIIPDLMFPIPPLPDAALTFGLAASMNMLVFCLPPRETGLDERTAQRTVGIARWQAPYHMYMLGFITFSITYWAKK